MVEDRRGNEERRPFPPTPRRVELNPKNNPAVTTRGYLNWINWVSRTGNKSISQAVGGALLMATYGTNGHNCYATHSTLADATGQSTSPVKRQLEQARKHGALSYLNRPGSSMIYCVRVVGDDGHPTTGQVSEPCPSGPSDLVRRRCARRCLPTEASGRRSAAGRVA